MNSLEQMQRSWWISGSKLKWKSRSSRISAQTHCGTEPWHTQLNTSWSQPGAYLCLRALPLQRLLLDTHTHLLLCSSMRDQPTHDNGIKADFWQTSTKYIALITEHNPDPTPPHLMLYWSASILSGAFVKRKTYISLDWSHMTSAHPGFNNKDVLMESVWEFQATRLNLIFVAYVHALLYIENI